MKYLPHFLFALLGFAVIFGLFKFFGQSTPKPAMAFEWEKTVSIYFGNTGLGSSKDCSKVFPVERKILNAETFGPGALEALLLGPAQIEKTAGYFTSLNEGVVFKTFEIKDGVAFVDFDANFNEGVAGSCRIQNLKAQIETTLNNLPDIDSVVLSVNGQTEGILEP
jgi:hypothetical protein